MKNVTLKQVNEVLGESGPWSLVQANEMASKLLAVRGIRNPTTVEKLGEYIWDMDTEPLDILRKCNSL